MSDNGKRDDEPRAEGDANSGGTEPPVEGAAASEPANEPAAEQPTEPRPDSEPAPKDEASPLEQVKQEADKYRNQMLRIAADFENFRKRSRRELEDATRRSREEFLRELLPVFDNLERAATHAEQASEARAVADGVKMVLRQFNDTIGRLGVARVKAVGAPFDPNLHEAIQQLATNDQPPGTVVAEVLPGYTWDERLLRAAMVVVSKAPPPPAEPEPEPKPSDSSSAQ